MKWHMYMWFLSYLHKSLTLLFSCSRPLNKKSKVSYFTVSSTLCTISGILNMLNQMCHLKSPPKSDRWDPWDFSCAFSKWPQKSRRVTAKGLSRDWSCWSFCFPFLFTYRAPGIDIIPEVPFLAWFFPSPFLLCLRSTPTLQNNCIGWICLKLNLQYSKCSWDWEHMMDK